MMINKRFFKLIASTAIISLVLSVFVNVVPVKAAAGNITRIGGSDRYQTAAQVAEQNWTTSNYAILVSGQGYADSISASVLAKKLDAPILLTAPQSLDSNVQTALAKLKPQNIYIIGGNASISESIEDGLKENYENVTRLGGNTRYDTNLAVANELVKLGLSKDSMIAVAGTGFADALSVAPVASATNQILLLTNNNESSMQKTIDFAKNSNVTVVGTTNSVSEPIYDAINAKQRIDGGKDRFATNLNILKEFSSNLKTDKLYIANASGQKGYADALVASALAGKYLAPLVLTDAAGTTATTNAIEYIGNEASITTDLQAVGGSAVMPDSIIQEIDNAINGDNVVSVTSVALNKVSDTLIVGDTDTLIATVSPDNATNKSLTWKSSNEKAATVDSSGKVTAIGEGTAIITAVTADGSKTARCSVIVNPGTSKDEIVKTYVTNIVNSVTNSSMTDYEKELALHDYVVNNCKYDPRVVAGQIPDNSDDTHTAYGALVNGVAVCDGYAEAMNDLLTKAGIPSVMVIGSANTGDGSEWIGHAWNIVKIQGKYYQLDTTWDDPVSDDGSNYLSHQYFNLTDSEMSKEHKWNTSLYPKCDTEYGSDIDIESTFKDKNLEQAVRDTINKPTGDLYESDVIRIDYLDASDRGIEDISGIENLLNLQYVDLYENNISDISALNKFQGMQYIDLSDNNINDISKLKGLTYLQALYIDYNKLNNISVLKDMTNLKYLSLCGDSINDISVLAGLNGLQYLDLSENNISDISALKGSTQLENIYLHDNQISDINVLGGLTNLTELNLYDNQIKDINPLKNLVNLGYIDLGQNQVSDDDIEALESLLPNCQILN